MQVLDLKNNNLQLLTFQLNNFTFRIFFSQNYTERARNAYKSNL